MYPLKFSQMQNETQNEYVNFSNTKIIIDLNTGNLMQVFDDSGIQHHGVPGGSGLLWHWRQRGPDHRQGTGSLPISLPDA
jgi:hypothetical protein